MGAEGEQEGLHTENDGRGPWRRSLVELGYPGGNGVIQEAETLFMDPVLEGILLEDARPSVW